MELAEINKHHEHRWLFPRVVLLPPSGHVPIPCKARCYHLCPCDCTCGDTALFLSVSHCSGNARLQVEERGWKPSLPWRCTAKNIPACALAGWLAAFDANLSLVGIAKVGRVSGRHLMRANVLALHGSSRSGLHTENTSEEFPFMLSSSALLIKKDQKFITRNLATKSRFGLRCL